MLHAYMEWQVEWIVCLNFFTFFPVWLNSFSLKYVYDAISLISEFLLLF